MLSFSLLTLRVLGTRKVVIKYIKFQLDFSSKNAFGGLGGNSFVLELIGIQKKSTETDSLF